MNSVDGPVVGVGVRPRSDLLPRRAYIPLVVLVVVSAIMALLGVADARGWLDDEAVHADTPAVCTSDVAPGDPTVWSGPQTDESEAAFAAHSTELAMPAIEGEEGFVFWSDVQVDNFSQLLGRAPWLDPQRDGWRDYLDDLRHELQRDGTDLVIVIAPSSGTIYPQYLPEWSASLRGLTHMDQLLSVAGNLPIVDVRSALIDASKDEWVYSAVNSHWTPYGAHVAWGMIGECIQALYPESGYGALPSADVVTVDELEPPNEFAEWGVTAPRADWAVPTLDRVPRTTTRTAADGTQSELTWPDGVDMLELPVTTTGGAINKTVLIAGDSQGTALSALWAESFTSTIQIRHYLDDMGQRANILDAARQSDVDLVVLEFAERYLSLPAPTVVR